MTGYAIATQETPHGSFSLEIRSVRNRDLDVQFRLLERLQQEPAMREWLAYLTSCGKVERRSISPFFTKVKMFSNWIAHY